MVTVIIPIYNIQKRGIQRVHFSLYSLSKQLNYLDRVIIVDGSDGLQYEQLNSFTRAFNFVHHTRIEMNEFNKPKLLNRGIEMSQTDYIMCTDADYVFSKDMLQIAQGYRSKERFLHKEVKMMPRINMTKARVDRWYFPKSPFNQWGKLANGAMQYAHKDFFTNEPYEERIVGFEAMDNLQAYKAKNYGLEVFWIPKGEGEILHQYHRTEKRQTQGMVKQSEANQKILREYTKEHNIAMIL